MSSPADSHEQDTPMGRVYVQVVLVQAAVLVALWFLQQYFTR